MPKRGKDLALAQQLASTLNRFTKLHTLRLEDIPLCNSKVEALLRDILGSWIPSTNARYLALRFSISAQRHRKWVLHNMRKVGDIVIDCCAGTLEIPIRQCFTLRKTWPSYRDTEHVPHYKIGTYPRNRSTSRRRTAINTQRVFYDGLREEKDKIQHSWVTQSF